MRLKTIESVVLEILQNNKRARSDDFLLYGSVLKKFNIDLMQSLAMFLASAKANKVLTFESVTRCRRHLQELNQDLKDFNVAVVRENEQEKYKNYNLSGIGE